MFETIQTLSESKLFRTVHSLDQYSNQELGEFAYLYIIGLRILLHEKQSHSWSRTYCRKTINAGNTFSKWRIDGTDLYALLFAITQNRKVGEDEPFEEPLVISPYKIYNWLSYAATDKLTENITNSLFAKLDSIFRIQNTSMRSIRRLVMDWDDLDKHEKQLAVTRYLQIIRSRMQRSEILPQIQKLARDHGWELEGVCNLETGEGCDDHETKKKQPKGGMLSFLAGIALSGALSHKKKYKENASVGATCAANVATAISSQSKESIGAGFDPSQMDRSVYSTKKKENKKPLVIRRNPLKETISDNDISRIIKREIKKSGFSKDALCSGGKCYEFRDHLYDVLKNLGYNVLKTGSNDWNRGDARKYGPPVGYAEFGALEDNPHAWIYYNGKHYDALNPEGVSRPSDMRFYKPNLDLFRPDEDEIYYQMTKHNMVYDPHSDRFVKNTKKSK